MVSQPPLLYAELHFLGDLQFSAMPPTHTHTNTHTWYTPQVCSRSHQKCKSKEREMTKLLLVIKVCSLLLEKADLAPVTLGILGLLLLFSR